MSIFIGNTFIKKVEVRGKYRDSIKRYEPDEDGGHFEYSYGDWIMHDDFCSLIDQIESDINQAICTLESNHDSASAIDELKLLAAKLY